MLSVIWRKTPFQYSGNQSELENLSSSNTCIASVRGGRSWRQLMETRKRNPVNVSSHFCLVFGEGVFSVPVLSSRSHFFSIGSPSAFVLCPSPIGMIPFSLMERISYAQEIWARTHWPWEAMNTWLKNTVILCFVQTMDGTTQCFCTTYRQYYGSIFYLTSSFFCQTCLNKCF